MPSEEKVLYLTFDDGPIPEVTEFVLDTLEKYRAKATFFCIGDNVSKYSSIFEKVRLRGHSIGNHTFNHLNGWQTADKDYLANVRKCDLQLPVPTNLFRPPYGRIKLSQAKKLLPSKKIVMWDVLSGDFSPNISSERCLFKTIKHSVPGSILLFHDSLKAKKNMEYTLPRVLEHFGNLDYTFQKL